MWYKKIRKAIVLSLLFSMSFLQTENLINAMEPTGGVITAVLSLVCPPAAVVFTAAEVVTLSVVGIGAYCAYKKNKKKIKIIEDIKEKKSSSCSSGGAGKDPKDKYDKEKHPHGIYEDAPYHHKNSRGRKGPCPKNGQTALDNSVSIESGNSKERVGISNEEIVILKKTSDDLFHGYVMTWEELEAGKAATQAVRNALIKNRLVTRTGKIIKK